MLARSYSRAARIFQAVGKCARVGGSSIPGIEAESMDPKCVGSEAAHRAKTKEVGGNSISRACSSELLCQSGHQVPKRWKQPLRGRQHKHTESAVESPGQQGSLEAKRKIGSKAIANKKPLAGQPSSLRVAFVRCGYGSKKPNTKKARVLKSPQSLHQALGGCFFFFGPLNDFFRGAVQR